jgi:hypothetical protein
MAIKGVIAKQEVANKILELFGDKAFVYDKDIRVNCVENGEVVQIKIALTAAKVAVEKDGDTALPAAPAGPAPIPRSDMIDFENPTPAPQPVTEPTAQEKANIKNLLEKLGL